MKTLFDVLDGIIVPGYSPKVLVCAEAMASCAEGFSFDVDSEQAESMIRVAKHWLNQQKNGNGEWSRMRDEAKAALTCYMMSNQVASVGTAEMWENDFKSTTPERWFDLPAQECEGLHWLNDAHFLTEVEWDIDLQEWVVA